MLKITIILTSLFLSSTIFSRDPGDMMGNGGGPSELNFAYSLLNYQETLSRCLSANSCQLNAEQRKTLKRVLKSWNSYPETEIIYLGSSQFHSQKTCSSQVICFNGNFVINKKALYTSTQYFRVEDAFNSLITSFASFLGLPMSDTLTRKVSLFAGNKIKDNRISTTRNDLSLIINSLLQVNELIVSDGENIISLSQIILNEVNSTAYSFEVFNTATRVNNGTLIITTEILINDDFYDIVIFVPLRPTGDRFQIRASNIAIDF